MSIQPGTCALTIFPVCSTVTHGGNPAKETTHADYNAGGMDIDTFFVEVISFTRSLSEEE